MAAKDSGSSLFSGFIFGGIRNPIKSATGAKRRTDSKSRTIKRRRASLLRTVCSHVKNLRELLEETCKLLQTVRKLIVLVFGILLITLGFWSCCTLKSASVEKLSSVISILRYIK
jgi:hypothetical protein